jgi:hypothetical protein
MNYMLTLDTGAGRITVRPWQVDQSGYHLQVEAEAMRRMKYWIHVSHLQRQGDRLLDCSDQANPVLLRKTTEILEDGRPVQR